MTADAIRFLPTSLPGVLVIEPKVWRDDRGFFLETWQAERYAKAGIDVRFVQDNHSRSGRGTLRGLHANARRPQGKLVRCVEGEIFDVAVDIRRSSPTFGRWEGVRLSAADFRQIWVPPGFAHGFCVLSDAAQVEYKVTDYYDPDGDLYIAWDDPAIGIVWPLEAAPLLSSRDRQARRLRDQMDLLPA
jgi:dTDP-4-dehydrorhamnose 3,5-epimerase